MLYIHTIISIFMKKTCVGFFSFLFSFLSFFFGFLGVVFFVWFSGD